MIISILKWILIVFVFLFAFVNSLAVFYDLFFNKKLKQSMEIAKLEIQGDDKR